MSDSTRHPTDIKVNFKSPGIIADKQPHQDLNKATTLRIAVWGDFSGRDHRAEHTIDSLAKRRLIEVDRDNFQTVLDKFSIVLRLKLHDDTTPTIAIPIHSLEDFHPDQLYQRVDIFDRLRDLRRRLQDNSTFAQAAQEVQAWLNAATSPQTTCSAAPSPTAPASIALDNLLDTVVGISQDTHQTTSSVSGSVMVDRLVRQIVAPYVEARSDPRQDQMLASIDAAIAAQLRFILHHPQFQALEAAWLSLMFLVERIATDAAVKIYILDISKTELDADLSCNDITSSGLYQRLCDRSPEDPGFDLFVGNFSFDTQIRDVLLLSQLGEIAAQAGTPLIAAAHEHWLGCESFAVTSAVEDWQYPIREGVSKAWGLLRALPVAEKLALTVPRFLLRLPYGEKSRPIDSFEFEEMPALHCHSCYLWGNGAFLKAEQIARAFTEKRTIVDTDNLPLHSYWEDGESTHKPCAEIQLTERGGQRISQQGLIPLWSVQNSDRIRCSDFGSLALSGKSIF
ncbi:MAG: type VI secretion system contractile sheath large subunit [Gammaproteobacteria bacterium]|nr:type VI secretion system contractile sheath large subunit [Gammaproteobacteria bacterium]